MKLNLKISLLIFLVCILFRNSYSQQNTNGWYWINGQPQSNTLNWVKKIDANRYYAVGESGTFMKSTDGGESWLINSSAGVLDPSFGSLGTLRLYSAWFFNANTGIVTGQSVFNDGGIIRRTTDAGQTFTSINLGLASGLSRVTDIYFINSTTGYICGNNTVKALKTTDAGLSWTSMSNLPAITAPYKCIYAKDVNNIFIGLETEGSSGQRRIIRTSNAGTTWKIDTLPGTTIHTINDIEFQNADTGFLAGNGTYFGYTTNGGANWTQAIFPNTQMGLFDLEIIGSTVYVLGSYESYYYTSNLGVTWDSVNFDDNINVNQPYQSLVYSFDLEGNDAIVVGLNGKINISNDAGSSWRNVNYSVGNNEYGFSSIYALPGTGKVWAGSNGGGRILYSSNNGTNWTLSQTSAANSFYDINMLNSNTGYAAGGSFFAGTGYCFRTTNSGVVWTSLPITNPGAQVNTIDFVNVNTGWLAGIGGVLSKTTNGGTTWTTQTTTPVYTLNFSNIDMFDANTGYLVSGANVWKTTNGGNNWDRLLTLPLTLSWNKVQTFSNNTLYLGGGQRIYKSYNGGATWDSVFIPSIAGMFDMDWFDLSSGTVVGTAGYTAKTSNGGLTWTERNPGSSTLTEVSMISKDTVFAVCDRNVWGAIFRLYDVNTSVTFNLTIGIEGFWNGTTQVSDTIKCNLRSSVSPYNLVDSDIGWIDNDEYNFIFDNAPAGSYYIEIKHRNSIETWSGLPQAVVQGGTYNYNFTTSASQAFGNNMILKSGRYCNYSGDVNQDGAVTLNDLLDVYNSSSNFQSGYVVTDVNGDSTVDLSDLTIAYNNSANFVAKVIP